MHTYKHSLQIAASAVLLAGGFCMLSGNSAVQDVAAQGFSSPSGFYSSPLPPTSQYSSPLPPASQYSSPLPPASQYSSPNPPTSQYSSPNPPTSQNSSPTSTASQTSTASHFSRTSTASRFSTASTASTASHFSYTSTFSAYSFSMRSFSYSYGYSAGSFASAGDLGGLNTGGGVASGGGGTYGGLIGIGGTYGGTLTIGGGGGSAVQESALPAKKEDCLGPNASIKRTCVPLIQPLGGANTIAINPGAQTFIDYFNEASSLLLTVSVGFAVLWILIGSYFIMVSGSDGGKRSTGKSIITWALIGLIIVNFAGFFLRTLNNIFFT